jgi:hypothetical protein
LTSARAALKRRRASEDPRRKARTEAEVVIRLALALAAVAAASAGGRILGVVLTVTNESFDFINLVSGVVYGFVLPYAAIASTYLYFDLRVARQQGAEAEDGDVLPAETAPAAAGSL